jgi:anthranilate phosphoribosyltransferase
MTMDYGALIKEIGRGSAGARALDYPRAFELFGAMLDAQVPDLELGAIAIAYRLKGETIEELKAFVDATHRRTARIESLKRAVVIPSYNGARHRANLLPLLALLLRDAGVPVLIHGTLEAPSRVSTASILSELNMAPSIDACAATKQLKSAGLAFIAIEALAPGLARLLDLRRRMGVRNSAHTVCKMLNPLGDDALQLLSVTHPEYHDTMHAFYAAHPANILLMRGTEGEAIANTRRAQSIEWLHGGRTEELIASASAGSAQLEGMPRALDARSTAEWIEQVRAGFIPVPAAIAAQRDAIVRLLHASLHRVERAA